MQSIVSMEESLSHTIADSKFRSQTEAECRNGASRQCRAVMQRTNLPAVFEEADPSLCKVTGRVASFHKHFMGACRLRHLVPLYDPVLWPTRMLMNTFAEVTKLHSRNISQVADESSRCD